MAPITFEATVTDRTIRIPDDCDVALPATFTVIMNEKILAEDRCDADEFLARIRARAEAVRAGKDNATVNGVTFKEFSRFSGRLPEDWKFDRDEIHERR